jgi:hypothetical protein
MAVAIVVADYFIGRAVSLTILFIVPVALASRLSGRTWGLALGILMPLSHLDCAFFSKASAPLGDLAIDAAIRIAVLVAFGVLIDRTTRQAREIRVLHGFLPVCSFCRKIRTEDQRWQPMEAYITEHSEASFTHTFCPECAREHYGTYLDQAASGQRTDARAAPNKPQQTAHPTAAK